MRWRMSPRPLTKALHTFLDRIAVEAARNGRAVRKASSMLGQLRHRGLVIRVPLARKEMLTKQGFVYGYEPTVFHVWISTSGEKALSPEAAALFRLGQQEDAL